MSVVAVHHDAVGTRGRGAPAKIVTASSMPTPLGEGMTGIPAIPIRRQPTAEELAWACAFLCSTRSAAITGAVIHVNGGQWMFG